MPKLPLYLTFLLCLSFSLSHAQEDSSKTKTSFWKNSEKPHKGRIWGVSAGLGLGYSATVIGLNQVWYAGYPRSKFHFFNDWDGWRQMDKAGHAYTGYFEAKWLGQLYQWSGVKQKKAAWIGAGTAMLFQTSLEMLDGFSTEWGFSWADMGFNAIGSGLYLGQELLWREQRIYGKLSISKPRYSRTPIHSVSGNGQSSLAQRAENLYGSNLPALFLKEYNGQTIWLSVNPSSFFQNRPKWLPPWINISLGYGIENVFGAQKNAWTEADGETYIAPKHYQRYSQYLLSLDVDWERIPTQKPWLKGIFKVLNIFKFPFPSLEYNSLGKIRGHWIN